jgi:predicted peptidase
MKKLLILTILLMTVTNNAFAQEDLFESLQYQDDDGNILNYRLLIPDGYDRDKSYPLVLFLHGAGERGNDNEAQLKWGVTRFAEEEMMEKHPAIVIAPQVPENEFWAPLNRRQSELKTEAEPMLPLALSLQVVDLIIEEYSVDTDRIYITGLSMGGFGTWDAIIRHPDKFAAVLPICGGGDISKADRIAHLPIWNFHGALDQIVPADLSRSMIQAIRAAGGTPGYTEYPHVGHDSWIPAYNDDYVLDWLFSQSRKKD